MHLCLRACECVVALHVGVDVLVRVWRVYFKLFAVCGLVTD